MLKRQRSTPSFVPDAYAPQEPSIDMSERVVKRMRHLPSPQSQSRASDKGVAPWRAGESDGEEDVDEQAPGPSAPSEQAQRLRHAGEYKHVNSLLHDLHAEQRHRMLFSTSSPTQLPSMSHWRPHIDEFSCPIPSPPDKSSTVVPAFSQPQHESHGNSTSFMISIPSKDDSFVDHIEVKRVTQQYEDSNRFLGALFLNRRRQCDGEDTQSQT